MLYEKVDQAIKKTVTTFKSEKLWIWLLTFLFSDEPTGRLALVFELMDMNMYEAIKGRRHYLPE